MKFENEKGYIIIPDELKQNTKINWELSIGTHLIGEYKGICFDFEIIDYKHQKPKNVLVISYNGRVKEFLPYRVINLTGFGALLGLYNYDYFYNIGEKIIDCTKDGIPQRDLEIINRKNGHPRYYKIHCNKCDFNSQEHYFKGKRKDEYWISEYTLINGGGCPCCANQICVTGINDMWTTHPNLAELLANKEDGYKYTFGTTEKLGFKCQFCDSVVFKKPKSILSSNYRILCNCNDSVSYPEKIMFDILKQLKIDFIWQYSKTNCNWIKNKNKYDFYFEYNNEQYIIETHGLQHYEEGFVRAGGRTLQEEQENDKNKKELALKNEIKEENYIVIDCRKSDLNFIKNNVLHSKLAEIFDLSNIDWVQCGEYACKNIYKEICDIWNDLDVKSTTTINEITNIGIITIGKALKKGNELGWCDYDTNVNYKNDVYLKVTDLEDNLLGVYRGYKYLHDYSEEQFGKTLNGGIFYKITKAGYAETGNLKIKATSKEFYEENLGIKIPYQFKREFYSIEKNGITKYFKSQPKCINYISKKENEKITAWKFSTAMLKNILLYGYSIKKVWLTEQEFEKYHERNGENEVYENVKL